MTTRPSPARSIMTLFRQWEDVETALAFPKIDDAEAERLADSGNSLEDAMLALPARTAADFATKILAYTRYGQFSLDSSPDGERLIEEAVQLVRSYRPRSRTSVHPVNLLDAVRAAKVRR